MPGNIATTVEVAWNAGYTTAAASRTWTDITGYVEPGGVEIQRGRQNEMSEVSASTCGLTLDNRDGRFTPEYAGGAYYPNVKKGRPIRVRVAMPGNLLPAADASTEVGGEAWIPDGAFLPSAVGSSGTVALYGTQSIRAVWNASAGVCRARLNVSGLTIGETYTFSAYGYVFAGNPDVRLEVAGIGTTSSMSTKDAWTRMSFTFVATGTSHILLMARVSGTTTDAYFDGMMLQTGSSATDFTTEAPFAATQFLGYVDEWPVEWPGGSDAMATASIKATSRMARLSLGLPYRSIVEEEILDDDPVGYWPLGEPEGATEAGNIAAGRSERLVVTQRGSGGTLAFGTGTGPGTDDLTAPIFTPVDASNGLHLLAALLAPMTQTGDKYLALEAWCVTSSTDKVLASLSVGDSYFTSTGSPYTATCLMLSTSSTGKANAGIVGAADAIGTSANSTTTVNDGLLHQVVAVMQVVDSGVARVSVIVDGVQETTSSDLAWPFMQGGAAFFPPYNYLSVGGIRSSPSVSTGAFMWPGTVAHVAVLRSVGAFTTARFTAHYDAGVDGFDGEASGARIARYARMAGIPTAEIATETGLSTSIAHRDTTGQSAIQMMQDVAHTEDGVVFDGKDGTLTFHARDHRYAATTAFTLSCADGEVEPNLAPVLDDQGMLNDVTASREGGATARSVNQASIDEYGVYRDSVELMTTSDNEVQSRADWEVNRRGTPRVKLTAVTVDVMVASDAQAALILAADIGTRFTVEDLPAQAPATSMDFFVEGITYDIADDRFVATFNTSAAVLSTVWILDSATLSQLDSTTVLAY